MVIFTNKVSHRAKNEALNVAKMNDIPVYMHHSCGVCTLRDCLSCLRNVAFQADAVLNFRRGNNGNRGLRSGNSGHEKTTRGSIAQPRPMWQELSRRFPHDRDCLASYLALETAEVLEGVKPANLVNVVNKRRSCGRT